MTTIQKITMFAIMIGITLFMALTIHLTCKEEPVDPDDGLMSADLEVDKCPVCEECSVCQSCKITVDKIIQDNPTITIPDKVVSFKYKGKIYTKAVLDEAKLTLETK